MFLDHPDERELKDISLDDLEQSLLGLVKIRKDIYIQLTDENHRNLREIKGFIPKKDYDESDKSIYDQYGKIETENYVFRFVRFHHSRKELVDCI